MIFQAERYLKNRKLYQKFRRIIRMHLSFDLPDGASSSSTSFLMEFVGSEEADLSLQNETGFSWSAGVTVKTLLSDSQSKWSKMRRQNESPETVSDDRKLVVLTPSGFQFSENGLKVST